MGWLNRVHLSQPLSPAQLSCVQQTSSKILPSLATLLPSLSHYLQLPSLEFLHWCLLHLSSDKKLRASLASTLRRIGDCVYRPMVCHAVGNFEVQVVGNETCLGLKKIFNYWGASCMKFSFFWMQMGEERGEKTSGIFIKSSNAITCMLSCLVTLQTLTQGKHTVSVSFFHCCVSYHQWIAWQKYLNYFTRTSKTTIRYTPTFT